MVRVRVPPVRLARVVFDVPCTPHANILQARLERVLECRDGPVSAHRGLGLAQPRAQPRLRRGQTVHRVGISSVAVVTIATKSPKKVQ